MIGATVIFAAVEDPSLVVLEAMSDTDGNCGGSNLDQLLQGSAVILCRGGCVGYFGWASNISFGAIFILSIVSIPIFFVQLNTIVIDDIVKSSCRPASITPVSIKGAVNQLLLRKSSPNVKLNPPG